MVVFTVIIGSYDTLNPISVRNESWRYVCITDDLSIEPNGWELMPVSILKPPNDLSGVRLQRWVKVIGGIKFFKCDTIYLDGSHEVIGDVTELMTHLTENIALKRHPNRNCYVSEGEACKRLNKADYGLIDKQIEEYKDHGLPIQFGMFETGILLRRYNRDVVSMCVLWNGDISKYTHRDQLSIPWALFETRIQYDVFDNSKFKKYIKIHRHNEEV